MRSHSLAAPVALALARAPTTVGSWLHAQLVVLDDAGRVLGATGVLSVVVLPDTGRVDAAHEQRIRSNAAALWQRHGILDATAFWNEIVSR